MVTVWTEAMQGETDLKRGATLWFPTTGDQGTAVLIPLSLVFFFFFLIFQLVNHPGMLRMITQPLSVILLKFSPAENFPTHLFKIMFSLALASFMLFCSLVGDGAATLVKTDE